MNLYSNHCISIECEQLRNNNIVRPNSECRTTIVLFICRCPHEFLSDTLSVISSVVFSLSQSLDAHNFESIL